MIINSKDLLSLITICLCYCPVLSQEYSREFGNVSRFEAQLESFDKDPEAEAVIFYDIGESYFYDTEDGGYNIRFTRSKRIKIFEHSGVKYSEITIPYYVDGYGRTEVVQSISATSYNFDDGIPTLTKLDPSTIYEEKLNDQLYAKKFAIPKIQ